MANRNGRSITYSGVIVGIVAGTVMWIATDELICLPIGVALGIAMGLAVKR